MEVIQVIFSFFENTFGEAAGAAIFSLIFVLGFAIMAATHVLILEIKLQQKKRKEKIHLQELKSRVLK